MRLPAQLLRRNPDAHKNQFGHALIVAGSPRMLGAAALCGLSAMRSGAGLVTLAVARSLNLTLQRKISPVIMTLPLAENARHYPSVHSYKTIENYYARVQALAIGPGLGQDASVKHLVLKIIRCCSLPLVIDADALNILSGDLGALQESAGPRVLTPHPGEMARLTGLSRQEIEAHRPRIAEESAKRFNCVLLLKGHRSVVAAPGKKSYINRTGNAGMASAGSGDVLTGMIVAFLAQGVEVVAATTTACHLHGRAGDLAARRLGQISMIATDLIDEIPNVML